MESEWIAATLGILIPFLIYLFWALVVVAIVWGITKLIKKSKSKSTKN